MKLTGEKTGPNPVLCRLGNVVSPSIRPRGRPTARKAVGCMGRGSRKKQMVGCNGRHRRWNITLPREWAHFRSVLYRENEL